MLEVEIVWVGGVLEEADILESGEFRWDHDCIWTSWPTSSSKKPESFSKLSSDDIYSGAPPPSDSGSGGRDNSVVAIERSRKARINRRVL